MNPYAEAAESNVRALSAAQRYAAALLLYNDDFHFKRKQTVVSVQQVEEEEEEEEEEVVEVEEKVILIKEVEKGEKGDSGLKGGKVDSRKADRQKALTGYSVEDIMNDRRQSAAARGLKTIMKEQEEEEKTLLYVIEGAYRILDEGISMFREGEVFSTYYESRKSEMLALKSSANEGLKVSPFRAGCITRQLRALELYAMSPSSVSPPPAVKHILKRLNKTLLPAGAKDVLKDMNYNPKASVAAAAAVSAMRLKRGVLLSPSNPNGDDTISSGSSGSSSFYSSITPWTEEVFDAANALADEVDRRRKEMEDSRPGPAGKKGPSGRMDYR